MKVLDRAQQAVSIRLATGITARQAVLITVLVGILALAFFTRFWRLDTPNQCYFDEVYFPTTGAEILKGDKNAWQFFGHENTHPPLSKLFMAGGMALFGHQSRAEGSENQCWGDEEDAARRTDPSWTYKPVGWRFFGALAGVGSIIFIFFIGRKLFESDYVGALAAFLLTIDGLAFAQARIATPDTYVLFFVLGTIYFLLSGRWLLSGIFFGAAIASKLTALFAVLPIALYLLYRYRQTERRREDKLLYLAPLSLLAFYLGTVFIFTQVLAHKTASGLVPRLGLSAPAFSAGIGAWMTFWALVPLLIYLIWRFWLRRRGYHKEGLGTSLLSIPLFFIVTPLYIYFLSYLPMLANGHSLEDVFLLNKAAVQFHSTLTATHSYQSDWFTWPIDMRPVFLYVKDTAKIYNLGNPIIFWAGLPALAFALWKGLSGLRVRVDERGLLSIKGRIGPREAALLFIVLAYLGFWLTWSRQPRTMFIYHYLNALPFLILALAYSVSELWKMSWKQIHPIVASFTVSLAGVVAGLAAAFLTLFAAGLIANSQSTWVRPVLAIGAAFFISLALGHLLERRRRVPWGQTMAVAFLLVAGSTFIYFYPHLAAVSVPDWLDESYFWFRSWR